MCRLILLTVLIIGVNATHAEDSGNKCRDKMAASRNTVQACLDDVVLTIINGENGTRSCKTEGDLNNVLKAHIENYRTVCNKTYNSVTETNYMLMLNHSLSDIEGLKAYSKKENLKCINDVMPKLNEYIKNKIENKFGNTSYTWKDRLTKQNFGIYNCDASDKLKNYTESLLQQAKCDKDAVRFVLGTFDYSKHACLKAREEALKNKKINPLPKTSSWKIVIIVIAVSLAIPIIIGICILVKRLITKKKETMDVSYTVNPKMYD